MYLIFSTSSHGLRLWATMTNKPLLTVDLTKENLQTSVTDTLNLSNTPLALKIHHESAESKQSESNKDDSRYSSNTTNATQQHTDIIDESIIPKSTAFFPPQILNTTDTDLHAHIQHYCDASNHDPLADSRFSALRNLDIHKSFNLPNSKLQALTHMAKTRENFLASTDKFLKSSDG